MKKIKLTQGKYALVDNEDYEYLNQWKWYCHVDVKGHTSYAKRTVNIKGRNSIAVHMHRKIVGAKRGQLVDHKNRNGLDNRRKNLRVVTGYQNQWNRKKIKSSSKYRGVSWHALSLKWMARLSHRNKKIYLGTYKTQREAYEVYMKAILKYRGTNWSI